MPAIVITNPLMIRENQWYANEFDEQVIVKDVANLYVEDEDRPLTVVFQSSDDGQVMAMPALAFLEEYSFIGLNPSFDDDAEEDSAEE